MKARVPKMGGPNNLNDMIRQAQKMQDDMEALQEQLKEREYTTTSGGGVVEVCIGGDKVIKSLKIKPEAVDPEDVEMLEDLVLAAVNEAIRTVEETNAAEMDKVTNGLNVPGIL